MPMRDQRPYPPHSPTTHYGPPPPPPEANGLGRYMAQIAGDLLARMHLAEQAHAEHRSEAREHWAEHRKEIRDLSERHTALEVRVEVLTEKSAPKRGQLEPITEIIKLAGPVVRWVAVIVLLIAYMTGKADMAMVKSLVGLGGGH